LQWTKFSTLQQRKPFKMSGSIFLLGLAMLTVQVSGGSPLDLLGGLTGPGSALSPVTALVSGGGSPLNAVNGLFGADGSPLAAVTGLAGGLTGAGAPSGPSTNGATSAGAGVTSQVAAGSTFEIDDTVLLADSSDAEGSALLTKLLNTFVATFPTLKLSNLQLTPVSASLVSGNTFRLNYRITGQSGLGSFNVIQVIQSYRAAVKALNTAGLSYALNTDPQDFTIEDFVTMTYTSAADRDNTLKTVLNQFASGFANLSLINLNIMVIGDLPAPQSVSGARQVFYRITGRGSGKGIPFDFLDQLVFTYSKTSEVSGLLNKVLGLWQSSLANVVPSNVGIQFVSATPVNTTAGAPANLVSYRVFGYSQTQFSYKDILPIVTKSLQTNPIPGIGPLSLIGAVVDLVTGLINGILGGGVAGNLLPLNGILGGSGSPLNVVTGLVGGSGSPLNVVNGLVDGNGSPLNVVGGLVGSGSPLGSVTGLVGAGGSGSNGGGLLGGVTNTLGGGGGLLGLGRR
jgi:hypothetical protein